MEIDSGEEKKWMTGNRQRRERLREMVRRCEGDAEPKEPTTGWPQAAASQVCHLHYGSG